MYVCLLVCLPLCLSPSLSVVVVVVVVAAVAQTRVGNRCSRSNDNVKSFFMSLCPILRLSVLISGGDVGIFGNIMLMVVAASTTMPVRNSYSRRISIRCMACRDRRLA